jgi:hypothetical protein
LNPGKASLCRPVNQGHRIADLGGLQFLDPGDDVTDLAGAQRVAGHRLRGEHADLFAEVVDPVAIRRIRSFGRSVPSKTRTSITTPT